MHMKPSEHWLQLKLGRVDLPTPNVESPKTLYDWRAVIKRNNQARAMHLWQLLAILKAYFLK